ncbi:DUF1822 family protein [Trichocoleus desertorum AS-A10]|uniref:DUF1822 family protein n=1 Tax=Trichocoleus desertorum TaxID=1481672 RepID=UPI0032992AC2
MIDSTQDLTITLPIPASARQVAQQFAQAQPTPEKATQVYRNTLAVLLMRDYLQMLDMPINLEASYSWNPIARLCADVADLEIAGVGRLECRSIQMGDRSCSMPPEVWQDRIGYVVVQLDEACRAGTLLGFVPSVTTTMLPLAQLQSLDALLLRLHQPAPAAVQLGQWFNQVFEPQWQAIAAWLENRDTNYAMAFRARQVKGMTIDTPEAVKHLVEQLYANQAEQEPEHFTLSTANLSVIPALTQLLQTTQDEEIRWTAAELLWTLDPDHPAAGVRRITDLGIHLAGHAIALMVAILPKPEQKVAVLLRVYPMVGQAYLPPELQLVGLDAGGQAFLTTQARRKDDYIQLKFTADLGERFSVRIALESASIVENFVV